VPQRFTRVTLLFPDPALMFTRRRERKRYASLPVIERDGARHDYQAAHMPQYFLTPRVAHPLFIYENRCKESFRRCAFSFFTFRPRLLLPSSPSLRSTTCHGSVFAATEAPRDAGGKSIVIYATMHERR